MAAFIVGFNFIIVNSLMASALTVGAFQRFWRAAVITTCWQLIVMSRAFALDYEPISLECMVATADAIVVVKLPRHTEGNSYKVQVSKVLHGDVALGVLQVNEPAKWRGTPPHFQSTEALLFLLYKLDDKWEVSGPSGEGRISLNSDYADMTAIRLPLQGSNHHYLLDPLLDALEMATNYFSFQRIDKVIRPIRRHEKTEIKPIMARSEIHNALFMSLIKSQNAGLNCLL